MSREAGMWMVVFVMVPFVAVWALMRVRTAFERRRDAGVARQIALTDCIHRELGAVAAPVVRRGWLSGWTVSVPLPLDHEATVGAIVRITTHLFRRLDAQEPLRLRMVLVPREPYGYTQPTTNVRSLTTAGLRRAA
jgi:hypothetical protein